MKTKQSVTICIPAYNEEENLKRLIPALLKQKNSTYTLSKILIVSDGSTDNTLNIVKSFNNKRLVLIDGKERKGLAFRQNQLLSQANSDIIVLLNADIVIVDLTYIEKLITPIAKHEADMTSSSLMETQPRNFFEKSLYLSMQMKKSIFQKFKNGNNVYTCRGPARAFTKDLYSILRFPSAIGEDAYSYLFTVYHGFRFKAITDIKVYYTLPSNYKDHKRQSARFLYSRSNFVAEFGENFVNNEYKIPLKYIRNAFIHAFITHPISISLYLLILSAIIIRTIFDKKPEEQWETSISSKLITI